MEKHKIILTFDLEYWFESLSLQKYLIGDEKESLEGFIEEILFLLARENHSATFFVTNMVTERESELIKKIDKAGHEIAIHTPDHKLLWNKNPEQFERELQNFIVKIESLINKKPIGYRATSFSLNQQTKWMLKILIRNGIKYDSSIFPFKFCPLLLPMFKNYLYGLKGNRFSPYKIDLDNPLEINNESPLVEIPVSVYHCGSLSCR